MAPSRPLLSQWAMACAEMKRAQSSETLPDGRDACCVLRERDRIRRLARCSRRGRCGRLGIRSGRAVVEGIDAAAGGDGVGADLDGFLFLARRLGRVIGRDQSLFEAAGLGGCKGASTLERFGDGAAAQNERQEGGND
jgi:hypothetical protein